MKNIYIIEARKSDGSLDLSGAQPESYFGSGAITGMDEDAIAKAIFQRSPDAVLRGDSIPIWPAVIDARFIARRKTW